MNNFTPNPNEMKREINNFCKFLTVDVNKSKKKFIFEMTYGIARSQSCRLSEIARSLKEETKLPYIINRLSDNLLKFDKQDKENIKKRYYEKIESYFPEEDPIAILDDSDVAKRYGLKLEDLDTVIDASSKTKDKVPGYHVCESVILGKKEKQPISVYSKIYSCKSDDFKSMKNYTYKSIDAVREVLKRPCTFVADRNYDDKKIYKYIEEKRDYFVIRLDDRNLLFKGKPRNIKEVAKSRKGKIKMTLKFEEEEKVCYISETKVQLPGSDKEYSFVVVYGLSEDEPLMLLTNRELKTTSDIRKVVRLYFSRWRIEEYFRAKKQEYGFEKYMVRTLESMNTLNMILTMLIGYLGMIAEEINTKLIGIKLIYASESLREKPVVWLSQLAKGLGETLYLARNGIKNLLNKEKRKRVGDIEKLSLAF